MKLHGVKTSDASGVKNAFYKAKRLSEMKITPRRTEI